MKSGGLLFKRYEILELSAVTVPANADCTISVVRSIDTAMRAATGHAHADDPTPPGVAGLRKPPVVKAREANPVRKTYAEQISAFEATLALKSGRMDDIMDKAAEDGVTLDAEQKETYDDLEAEVKSISEHLARLRTREVANVAMARSVSDAPTPQALSEIRGAAAGDGRSIRIPAQVRALDLPKGTAFTRYLVAMGRAKGNRLEAADIAKQWDESTPEVSMLLRTPDVAAVLRSTIAAGTTTDATWASPLVVYQNMASEFVELLRPMTILGRIQGLRRVPFNIKIPRQTAGASAGWVGELQPKPVSSLAFDQISLGFCKVASIVPVSDELLRFSSPSAEQLIRDDLVRTVAQFIDLEFVDPTKAAEVGVSPASITYGVTPVTATGTTSTALRADVITLQKAFAANYISLASGVWIMSSQMALAISMMLNELSQPLYPGITMAGGTFLGLPVITSENVPSVGNSPTDGSRIILLDASQILLADDGQVTVDMSNEASLQMESSPDSPASASTVFVSLWQKNMTAFRVERYINWTTRHSNSVGYINGALYSQ
jgi:HK97 family phage major capsid protein